MPHLSHSNLARLEVNSNGMLNWFSFFHFICSFSQFLIRLFCPCLNNLLSNAADLALQRLNGTLQQLIWCVTRTLSWIYENADSSESFDRSKSRKQVW